MSFNDDLPPGAPPDAQQDPQAAEGQQPEPGEDEYGPQPHLPARPGMAVDYNVKLDDAALSELAVRVCREVQAYRTQTQPRRSNLEEWRRDYELVTSSQPGPWENCSALRAPFVRMACAQHTMRLQKLTQAEPPFACVPRKAEAADACPKLEQSLAAIMEAARWRECAAEVHELLPVDGNCLVRVEWAQRKVRRPKMVIPWDADSFADLGAAGVPTHQALLGAADADEKTGEIDVQLDFEDVVMYDGISLEAVPWRDSLILPASVRDPKDAYGIGEWKWVRGADIKAGVDAGKYLEEGVERLMNLPSDSERPERYEALTDQGLSPEPHAYRGQDDPLYRQWEVVELCWQDDLNGDGEQEWYVVTVHERSKTVIRCQYMPYQHGEPYYVPFRYLKRPRELFAAGLPEIMALVQDAATAGTNAYFDLVDILAGASGSFFYDDKAELDPARMTYKPGVPIKVGDVNSIKENPAPPQIPAALESLRQALAMLKDWCDLIGDSSNPVLGQTTEGQKTLGEIQIVFSQAMQQFERYGEGVALDWAVVWNQVRHLIAQFSDAGQASYRQSTPDGAVFDSVDVQTLLADVDIEPAGLHQFADQQTRLTLATLTLQQVMTNPLTMQIPQAQALALENWLSAAKYADREQMMALVNQHVQMLMVQQAAMAQQAVAQAQMGGMAGMQQLQGPPPGPGMAPNGGPPGAPPPPGPLPGAGSPMAAAMGAPPPPMMPPMMPGMPPNGGA